MADTFSVCEVLDMGVQIEKNGRDFYTELQQKTLDPDLSAVSRALAREEEKHIAVFEQMLEKARCAVITDTHADEYGVYMRALAGEHVFTRQDTGKDAAHMLKTDAEAIEKAIGFERDSIIFYEGMKKIVSAGEVEIVEALVAQEKRHLVRLINLKLKKQSCNVRPA